MNVDLQRFTRTWRRRGRQEPGDGIEEDELGGKINYNY